MPHQKGSQLQKQPLPIPLAVGENLGEDPKQSRALQLMRNCIIKRTGEIQLRPGAALWTGGKGTSLGASLTSATSLITSAYGVSLIGDTTGTGVPATAAGRHIFSTSASAYASVTPWVEQGFSQPLSCARYRGSAKSIHQSESVNVQVAEVPGYRMVVYYEDFTETGSTATGLSYDLFSLPDMTALVVGGKIPSTLSVTAPPFYVVGVSTGGVWNFLILSDHNLGYNGHTHLMELSTYIPSTRTLTYGPILTIGGKNFYANGNSQGYFGSGLFSACTFAAAGTSDQYAAVLCTCASDSNFHVLTFTGGATPTMTDADTGVATTSVNAAVSIGDMRGTAGKIVWTYSNATTAYVIVATAPVTGTAYAALSTWSKAFTGTPYGINAAICGASSAAGLTLTTVTSGNTVPSYILLVQQGFETPGISIISSRLQLTLIEWNGTTHATPTNFTFQEYNAGLLARPFFNSVTHSFMLPLGYVDETACDGVATNKAVHDPSRAVSWISELRNADTAVASTSRLAVVVNLQVLDARPAWLPFYNTNGAPPNTNPNNLSLCPATTTYFVVPSAVGETNIANSETDSSLKIPPHILTSAAPCVYEIKPRSLPSQAIKLAQSNITCLAGSVPCIMTPAVSELGFLRTPESIDPTLATGTALTSGGTYFYVATYEWTDSEGNLYTSAGSRIRPPQYMPGGSTLAMDTGGRTLTQTTASKAPQIRLVIWRTTNAAAGASLYYRDGAVLPGVSVGTIGAPWGLRNTTTNSTIGSGANTRDIVPDSPVITAQPAWPNPATTGIFAPACPPACNIIANTKDRVFLVPDETPETLWVSNALVQGVGVTFPAELALNIPEGGAIVGLCAMDSAIIVGKSKAIYAFSGGGPDPTGNGGWSEIQRIAVDTGVRDSNSVLGFSGGVIFKSDRGYYLLDRTLQVSYIGRPVQHRNANICQRAVLMPTVPQIRFLEDDGTVLVFDYEHKAWSEFIYTFNATSRIVDICVSGTNFYILTANGTVYIEDTTGAIWTDNGADYPMTVRSPWVNLAGVDGFQRCWWVHLAGNLPLAGAMYAGPTTTGEGIVDGTAICTGTSNLVNWNQSHAYSVGDIVQCQTGNSYWYYCVQAGISSAVTSGPTGTGTAIVDGTCKWDFVADFNALYRDDWTGSAAYAVGDYVTLGANTYFYTTAGTSGSVYTQTPTYTVNLYNNYDDTDIVSTHTFDASVALVNGLIRVKPVVQKATALMTEFIATNIGLNGAVTPTTLSSLDLVIGVKGGKLARLGKASTR